MSKISSVRRRSKRQELHWMQNGRCFWCEQVTSAETATLDELLAQSRGGTAAWGNIVMACYPCNSARMASKPPAWALARARSLASIRAAAFVASQVLSGEIKLPNLTATHQ